MRRYFNIFTFCSIALIITLGGTALAYADETRIDQDNPFWRHGIMIIYKTDSGTVPTSAELTGGTAPFSYDLDFKTAYANGTTIYTSNLIRIGPGFSVAHRYQVEEGDQLVAEVNGIFSDPTKPVSRTSPTPVDIWIDGYKDLYEITMDVNCNPRIYGGDTDGDGICDNWETPNGLAVFHRNDPGTKYILPCTVGVGYDNDPLGITVCPDPNIPDLYFEIDSLEGHRPNEFALAKIASSLESSPYEVDGTVTGVHAHFQISDGNLPHVDSLPMPGGGILSGYDALKLVAFGTDSVEERGTADPTPQNFWDDTKRQLKSQVFHYIILGHYLDGSSTQTTGIAEIPGNDVLITLGGWVFLVGNEEHHAGTVMHEIGHNLNLHHGGSDSINCKPNYLSVMSYSRQFPDLIPGLEPNFSNTVGVPDEFSDGSSWTVPSGSETVYGMNQGASYQYVTDDTLPLPGASSDDFNKINSVDCDGIGGTYEGYNDFDNMVLLDRRYGTFDEGRGAGVNQSDEAAVQVHGPSSAANAKAEAVSKGITKAQLATNSTHKACNENIINPVVQYSALSETRTCIREDLSHEKMVQVRAASLGIIRDEFGPYTGSIDPSCMQIAQKTLTEIDANIREEIWDEAAIEIQNLIDFLDSEECIADATAREEIIGFLHNKLNIILRAIPEFETIAMIILSISIITVIALTSRSKLSLVRIYK